MKKHLVLFLYTILFLSGSLLAQSVTVTLDYFFNNEYKKNSQGVMERFHYIWEDKSINGYSIWGDSLRTKGAVLKSLPEAPTAASLKGTDIYIITDPDTHKESPAPNLMTATHAAAIAAWVKKGGVLVMMVNDSANAELHQFNLLADQFGIHFTDKVRNSVLKDISVGKIMVPATHPIFQKGKQLYLKGICTITLQQHAQAVLEDKGDVIMATARYGKGTVFAIADPWIYNEYIVNDRLNPDFQNAIAAGEFSNWLLKQVPPRSKQKDRIK